jgi:peptide/nickel transport system ATP-binding protein
VTLLEVRGLTVTYHGGHRHVPAVRGVDLDLHSGQTVGLVGESGCGKSTLALALLRLLPRNAAVSGEIRFAGEDVLTMNWGRLRALRWAGASIVFQGSAHALNPVRRIGDQIAEPLLVHRLAAPATAWLEAATLLDRVGINPTRASAYPHELSGGQRQRVMIAMALACRPRLIIADEPTTALDVLTQAQIMHLLGELVARDTISMLLVSHDMAVLQATCDRLAVMYAGRIVEDGPTQNVLSAARHPYSRALTSALPRLGDPGTRRNPPGPEAVRAAPSRLPTGCAYQPRCPVRTEVCSRTDPPLLPAGPRHTAACILLGDADRPTVAVTAADWNNGT